MSPSVPQSPGPQGEPGLPFGGGALASFPTSRCLSGHSQPIRVVLIMCDLKMKGLVGWEWSLLFLPRGSRENVSSQARPCNLAGLSPRGVLGGLAHRKCSASFSAPSGLERLARTRLGRCLLHPELLPTQAPLSFRPTLAHSVASLQRGHEEGTRTPGRKTLTTPCMQEGSRWDE